jgi:hypothetical protein
MESLSTPRGVEQCALRFAEAHGGHWDERDQPAVMGANYMQWAASMRENNGVNFPIVKSMMGLSRDCANAMRPIFQ